MIVLRNKILSYLKTSKKVTVQLSQLEGLFDGQAAYATFAENVDRLVRQGYLKPVAASGTNAKPLPLYHAYRINKQMLNNDLVREIQNYGLLLHPAIKLTAYISLSEDLWRRDLPLIRQLNAYLQQYGLPAGEASTPERSLALFGDEKWIEEKGGKALLERLHLWDELKIAGTPEPLMLAVNPGAWAGPLHHHLIVENKAVFYALQRLLPGSPWTSLIFGAGWKILANLSLAPSQLGLPEREHQFLYFGDLDAEGMAIWHGLQARTPAPLALPFYRALLKRSYYLGKTSQQHHPAAIRAFCAPFTAAEAEAIQAMLAAGGYLPQEALRPEELAAIWRVQRWLP